MWSVGPGERATQPPAQPLDKEAGHSVIVWHHPKHPLLHAASFLGTHST